jgi:hypothetical protein
MYRNSVTSSTAISPGACKLQQQPNANIALALVAARAKSIGAAIVMPLCQFGGRLDPDDLMILNRTSQTPPRFQDTRFADFNEYKLSADKKQRTFCLCFFRQLANS